MGPTKAGLASTILLPSPGYRKAGTSAFIGETVGVTVSSHSCRITLIEHLPYACYNSRFLSAFVSLPPQGMWESLFVTAAGLGTETSGSSFSGFLPFLLLRSGTHSAPRIFRPLILLIENVVFRPSPRPARLPLGGMVRCEIGG